jgi:protein-disulfide isomerase
MAIFLAAPGRAAMDAEQRQEVEAIIHEYLLANPEVLEEAFRLLQERREKEELAKQAEVIASSQDLIFDSKNQMVLGNPEGDVTLVEFFDYNCGYCKRAAADMTALLAANPDLRIVMKEFPILSEGSVEAARVSAAVKDVAPEHYLKFHQELLQRPGVANTAKALEIAGELGLDIEALKKAAGSAAVTENISEVRKLADSLGITGTPTYILGAEVVPGAVGFDQLQKRVLAVRECGVTVC